MKTRLSFSSLGVVLLLWAVSPLRAEIAVTISVKFILNSDGTRPSGTGIDISTIAGFAAEVVHGNEVLAATGRGCRVRVAEYLDIQPAAPAGQAADYWFNLPARSNRQTIETAALANTAAWRWNTGAINIYVNNSSSGQCSFIGGGSSISLGGTIFNRGTVLHEIGHFFNLSHTHALDYADNTNPATFTSADLRDGDGLAETANDNPNITTTNQLCVALFSKDYTNATPQEQAVVDSAYENVMSYHNENVLLPGQMDIWGQGGNGARLFACSGRTWFVANNGSDGATGDNAGAPYATLAKGLSSVGSGDDVILLRAGNYLSPAGGTITTRCTLGGTRGSVSILRP